MKVKMLTRNPDVYLRETKRDIHKLPRNYDPSLHPFEAPREYTRALNATKLERVFAKPFLGNLDGHRDGISSMCKHSNLLSLIASGDYSGEVRVWNLSEKRCKWQCQGHEGYVRGLCFAFEDNSLITVGQDKTIKIWNLDDFSGKEATNVKISQSILTGISHSRYDPVFATCGDVCQLWDESRNEPIRIMEWGVTSLHHVAYNHVETSVLATCASDRSIILYDTRERGPVRKVVLKMRTNQISWNPMEAFIFTAANEDYNVYSFDARRLDAATNVHKDHVAAVTCVDYAPTGREFATGSYDKTVRIFECNKGHSRDVYHTKRMQHVTSICWSLDNRYIINASDEMNIRLWKAKASEKLGVLKPREKVALQYAESLKQKFAHHPQIRRIARHRQIPKHVHNIQRQLHESRKKISRKEANIRAHSKKDSIPIVPERKKSVLAVVE